jgi:hypothetical protein
MTTNDVSSMSWLIWRRKKETDTSIGYCWRPVIVLSSSHPMMGM